MKKLFIAWKDEQEHKWLTVARLSYIKDTDTSNYIFCYTRGAKESKNFVPFGRFVNLERVYKSNTLFPLFENRILKSNRPEFKDLLTWLDLDQSSYDPLDILALTEGKRATDSLEIFPCPDVKDGKLSINFFSHGLSHINNWSEANMMSLQPGSRVYLCPDPQNFKDANAILLRSDDPITFVGYCPRYLAKFFNGILKTNLNSVEIVVKKINLNAPNSYKVLCSMSVDGYKNLDLSSDAQFLPIPNDFE